MNSIEWFFNEIKHIIPNDFLSKYEEAKKIHKQNVMNAFNQGYREGFVDGLSGFDNDQDVEKFDNANLYYQETFGSGMSEKPTSYIEISDEEIEKFATEKYAETKKLFSSNYFFSLDDLENNFIQGMKIYREQLKQKTNDR
jgi:hypothetical protein